VKINLISFYDILGSADARRQVEDSTIQRFLEKLDWLKQRVDLHNENLRKLEKIENHLLESGHDQTALHLDDYIAPEIDDCIATCDLFIDYNKAEWTAMVAILQTLVGEDPGDNNPFDTEAITEVLVEYRRWAKLAEGQEVADGVISDGKSQTASTSAAAGLNEAIEWAIREIGHPAHGVHWKTFCAKVWERCGVEPEAKGYSPRTIRRRVADRSN
jgi:hypothetical protein